MYPQMHSATTVTVGSVMNKQIAVKKRRQKSWKIIIQWQILIKGEKI